MFLFEITGVLLELVLFCCILLELVFFVVSGYVLLCLGVFCWS